MSTPFNLALKSILTHEAERRIRYESHLGDRYLSFTDVRTGGPVQVRDPVTGEKGSPTFEWVQAEFAAGRLKLVRPAVHESSGRNRKFASLDPSACEARDRKAPWRLQWAIAASKVGLVKTDDAYSQFIESRRHLIVSKSGFKPPAPSSLRRHVRKLETVGASTSVFVSEAGRALGQSQLPYAEDCLVHDVALRYWAEPSWSIRDAEAIMFAEWADLVDAGVDGLSKACPTYETLRLRVRKLETYETVKAKFGKEAADRKFGASGESIAATRPFERVFMDGTELEQIATFGGDLEIAGSKLKSVLLMDEFTNFVFPPVVFPGPYREEMSVEALIRMMSPPTNVPEELLAEEPFTPWCFGRPTEIIPDNDRTLIPPGYIPALTELGPEIDLPKVYHSDAKAKLEAFHKWLKARLRGLPGTVQLPRHRKDLRRDPVAEAELTAHQIRKIVDQLIWEHNMTPKAALGHRSPFDLMKTYMLAGHGPTLNDPEEPRRTLAKTHTGRVLTSDGLIFKGLCYRSPEMETVLKDNLPDTPMADRRDGTAKCIVTIRTFEADLDSILVFNAARNDFVRLYSTQHSYTAGLSRWEHEQYEQLAKQRREEFRTEQQRLTSRARSLALIDAQAPSMPFKRRATLAVLREQEQLRFMSGQRAEKGMPPAPCPPEDFSAGALSKLRLTAEPPPPGPKKDRADAAETSETPADFEDNRADDRDGNLRSEASPGLNWDEIGDSVDDDMDWDD